MTNDRPTIRRPNTKPASAAPRPDEPLEYFLQDIRDTPVLTAEQERTLGREMRESRLALRATLAGLSGVASRLVRDWRERERNGHVPHLLSERHEPGSESDEDLPRLIDSIERSVARKRGMGPASAELRRKVEAFDPLTSLQIGWVDELQHDLESMPRPGVSWGLPVKELRRAHEDAKAHRERHLDARSTFVRHNLRFVVHMAKDFRSLGLPFSDLIQEGNLGLIRAVEKFDERRGFRFSTYAAWWVQQAFHRCFQRDGRVVRLPATLLDRQRHIRTEEARLFGLLGRSPTSTELAEALGVEEAGIEQALRTREAESSLEAPVGDDGARSIGDLLADEEATDPVQELDGRRYERTVQQLLRPLDNRERQVLQGRFGLGRSDAKTLQVLAEELGLSRERVRQIEKHALARIRRVADARGLRERLG